MKCLYAEEVKSAGSWKKIIVKIGEIRDARMQDVVSVVFYLGEM
jgi:hypothetical protein